MEEEEHERDIDQVDDSELQAEVMGLLSPTRPRKYLPAPAPASTASDAQPLATRRSGVQNAHLVRRNTVSTDTWRPTPLPVSVSAAAAGAVAAAAAPRHASLTTAPVLNTFMTPRSAK